MASSKPTYLALLLITLFLVAHIVSANDCPPPPVHHKHHHHHPHKPAPTPATPKPSPPVVSKPTPPPATPKPSPPVVSKPTPPPAATCPVSIVKLGVCVPLLGGILGIPSQSDCCALLGLIGLDVEVCLCAAIDANVLGIINLKIPKVEVIATLLTTCGHQVPPNLSCP